MSVAFLSGEVASKRSSVARECGVGGGVLGGCPGGEEAESFVGGGAGLGGVDGEGEPKRENAELRPAHLEGGRAFLRGGARPPVEEVIRFIGGHRDRRSGQLSWGIEPIAKVLGIAPSTYHAAKSRPPSARAIRDTELKPEILRVWEQNLSVYGGVDGGGWGCVPRGATTASTVLAILSSASSGRRHRIACGSPISPT